MIREEKICCWVKRTNEDLIMGRPINSGDPKRGFDGLGDKRLITGDMLITSNVLMQLFF